MGPENKIKKMIKEKEKKEERSDTEFLIQYLNILNSQIKQTEQQLKGARLHCKHVISIMRKLRRKH